MSIAVRQAIRSLLELFEQASPLPDGEARLGRALDRLVAVRHDVSFSFDQTEYPEPPGLDSDVARELVVRFLPTFGVYNVPASLTENIASSSLLVGDAVDDLADVLIDLREVEWRWTNTSEADALWHFDHAFRFHLLPHVRWLQVYLLSRSDES
jgi:hypothetical protein